MANNHIEIYKRYRPTKWSLLIGQEKVARSLQGAVKAEKLPTAYLFAGPRGCGKALHRDTYIPTPTGFTTMGELKVGDIIFGANGRPTEVTHKYCPNDPEAYEISFSDGTTVKVSAGHLWEVEDLYIRDHKSLRYQTSADARVRKPQITSEDLSAIAKLPELVSITDLAEATNKAASFFYGVLEANGVATDRKKKYHRDLLTQLLNEVVKEALNDQRRLLTKLVLTTEEIFKTHRTPDGAAAYAIEILENSVEYENSTEILRVGAYALGVWLGDGTSSSPSYACSSEDAQIIAEQINSEGVTKASYATHDKRSPELHSYKLSRADGQSLTSVLRSMGVLHNKHIPDQYLYGSEATRRALLAGLLDTDGTVDSSGRVGFGQKDGKFFWQVVELVHSLGYQTRIHPGDVRTEPSLQFYTTDRVFRLARKNDELKTSLPSSQRLRYITNVTPVIDNPGDYFCVAVSAADQLFLATKSFIKTHNTSAALLLAKAVNCESPTESSDPCNSCDTCQAIDTGTQLGVNYISAANIGGGGAEKIREIVQQARLNQPVKRQVWIIDEIHNLSKQAFDSLLIPLEEKGMPALFIFCTTEIDRVPQTILSRIQQRRFTLVDSALMLKYVSSIAKREGLNLDQAALEDAVRRGRGSVRDTLTALEAVAESGEAVVAVGGALLEALSKQDITQVLTVVAQASTDGQESRDLAEQLFEDLRNLLLQLSGVDESLVGIVPVTDPVEVGRGFLGKKGVMLAMDEIGEGITQMSFGADARIQLEICLIKSLNQLARLKKAIAARG